MSYIQILEGDQLSSRKYEELLGALIEHKWTFEDYLLNIAQKFNYIGYILASTYLKRISKYIP